MARMRGRREGGSIRKSTWAFALILVATFFFRATGNMVQTTMPLLARYDLGLTNPEIGLAASLVALTGILAPTLIVSRMRPSFTGTAMLSLAALFAVTIPVYAVLGSSLELYATLVVTGTATGALFPLLLSVPQSVDPQNRDRNVALYATTLSMSLVAGPLIETSVLSADGGVRMVFLAFTALAVFAVAALALARRFPLAAGAAEPSPAAVADGGTPRARMRTLLRNRAFLEAVLGNLTYSIPFLILLTFGGVYVVEAFGVGYELVYLLFALFFVASMVTRIALTLLSPIARKLRWLAVSVALTILGLLLLGLGPSLLVVGVSFAVLGVPHGMTFTLSTMVLAEGVEARELPLANSLFFSIGAVVSTLTPSLIGALTLVVGLRPSFLVLILPTLALALALLRFSRGPSPGTAPRSP